MRPRIRFINHASFTIEQPDGICITDPWVKGRVFANGWDFIDNEIDETAIAGSNIKSIVFTHEHPDHFSPSFLNAIPKKNRPTIKVFYQKTRDKKLAKFVEQKGFQVVEVNPKQVYSVLNGITAQIFPFDKGDSVIRYVINRADNNAFSIINTNDCEFANPLELCNFLKSNSLTVSPDLLFTQFSYACYQGNPEDSNSRKVSAARKLENLNFQVQVIKPALVVPFASFIYFCHQENFSHNDEINTLKKVSTRLNSDLHQKFIFPEPNKLLEFEPHKREKANARALEFWAGKFSRIDEKELTKSVAVPLSELIDLSKTYVGKIRKFLSKRPIVGIYNRATLPDIYVYFTDLELFCTFHPLKGLRVTKNIPVDYLMISTDAFSYAMRFDWGWESIHVAARFQTTSRYYYTRVMHSLCLGVHANFQTSEYEMAIRIFRSLLIKLKHSRI